ncbi:hypothetical protein [Candidatus Synechococcus spongiarum]|uniref:Uncharacterized protein n=1 Tax=Candidatus Synechococcus spongiarum TaxID=431041 RepID=A0A164YX71_9SYNE|nr:hypothetical protein [Candidatus Synechococcus spongiarum]SAY38882.1 hypothetical protein FLM9_915 [Candidatus Synechococcus spongiarum]
MKRGLLVLVLLSPWLAAVWVGLHNLGQPRQLRLLTGTTPALPIGGWLLLSSSLGVTLGAGAGVLLQTGSAPGRRRQENSRYDVADSGVMGDEPNPDLGLWRDTGSSLGEPPPVIDVPFRVVRPGQTPGPDPDRSPSPAYNDPVYNNDDDWQPPQTETW